MSLDVSITKTVTEKKAVFEYNITHNLVDMAEACGLYKYLWRPEELGIELACELIEPLKNGLEELKNNRNKYEKFNSENGWGTYDNLVEFVTKYLSACREHGDGKISVWR